MIPTHAAGWTEDRIEQLKKLWLDGVSAGQIAATLGGGVTRNAVIGKVTRLRLARSGFARRANPAAINSATRGRKKRKAAPRVPAKYSDVEPVKGVMKTANGWHQVRPASPERKAEAAEKGLAEIAEAATAEPLPPVAARIGVMELQNHHCKWPIGDPQGDFSFCGQPRKDGSPYCDWHHARAYPKIGGES